MGAGTVLKWRRGQRPPYRYASLQDRIENKLEIKGDAIVSCWRWLGAYSIKSTAHGHKGEPRPVIQLAGRGSPVVHVLRVLLAEIQGRPLSDFAGVKACHKCDHAWCVNPHHAYWGTDMDNTSDRLMRQPESFWSKAYRRKIARLNRAEARR